MPCSGLEILLHTMKKLLKSIFSINFNSAIARAAFVRGLVMAFAHLCLVGWTLYQIYTEDHLRIETYWNLFIVVDFPISLISVALFYVCFVILILLENLLSVHFGNLLFIQFGLYFVIPAISHIIGGTLWWFYLPIWFAKSFDKNDAEETQS